MSGVQLPEETLAWQLFLAERNVGFGDGHAQYELLSRLRYVVRLHVTGTLPGHDPRRLLAESVNRVVGHAYRDRALTVLMRIYHQAIGETQP